MRKIEYKTCSKCKEDFPATTEFFYRQKDKLSSWCKECQKKQGRQWHKKNREASLKNKKKHYKNNKEYYAVETTRWKRENKDKHMEIMRDWRKNNKDKIREYSLFRAFNKQYF